MGSRIAPIIRQYMDHYVVEKVSCWSEKITAINGEVVEVLIHKNNSRDNFKYELYTIGGRFIGFFPTRKKAIEAANNRLQKEKFVEKNIYQFKSTFAEGLKKVIEEVEANKKVEETIISLRKIGVPIQRDMFCEQVFGKISIDVIALSKNLRVSEDTSLEDALTKKYGKEVYELIKSMI